MAALIDRFRGNGLFARAARGSVWTILGFGGAQAIRLASNLILARLLFPEAFGLMALVMLLIVGLSLFSDIGIEQSIMRNPRGEERAFLDTAWTMQVARGWVLWLAAWALALPAASFYAEPMLAQLLPVAAFSLVIDGFMPTRVHLAKRRVALGRVSALELAAQAAGTLVMIALALALQSVWALALGLVAGALIRLALLHLHLPGRPDRLRWEAAASREMMRFGGWIFLSTICTFAISQGDRAILGKYLTMAQLGVYSIGFALASMPVALGAALAGRLLIPLYRERPPSQSRENFLKLRRMRFLHTTMVLALLIVLAFSGPALVDLLYDARYAAAGAIIVLICVAQIPAAVSQTYGYAALAAGDSRGHFRMMAAAALVQPGLFLLGAEVAGLLGALVAQGAALILVHGLNVRLARRHGAWDALHDAVFGAAGLVLGGAALWLNWSALEALARL